MASDEQSSYTWTIPSLSKEHSQFIVMKYFRDHCLDHFPFELIDLCVHYFADVNVMDKIKTASNATPFQSDIFCIQHVKFYLDIWPNGYGPLQNGIVNLYLNLVSLSPNVSEFEFDFTISIKETNTKWSSSATFSITDTCTGWRDDVLSTKEIQKLDSLTIALTMDSDVDILDQEGNHIRFQSSSLNTALSHYDWHIDNKQLISTPTLDSPYFKMHNILWNLQVRHSKVSDENTQSNQHKYQLLLHAVTIPPNISSTWIYCCFFLQETSASYCGILHFEQDLAAINVLQIMNTNEMNTLTFRLEMTLVDIFDQSGKCITNKYLHLNDDPSYEQHLYSPCHEIHTQPTSVSWRMPFVLPSKISLLLCGYLRAIRATACPDAFLNGCAEYLADDMNVSDICTVPCGSVFESKVFDIGGFKWCLVMYPNGIKAVNRGDVQVFIHLLALPPTVSKISFHYRIELVETASILNRTNVFTNDHRSEGWAGGYLQTQRIQNLNQLTFNLDLKIFDVYHNDGNIISNNDLQCKYHSEYTMQRSATYEWNITDTNTIHQIQNAQRGIDICSDFFGLHSFIWYLELYPLGMDKDNESSDVDLYLTLASLPPTVSSIAFKYELYLKETDTKFESFTQFDTNGMSEGWPTYKLTHDTLQNVLDIDTTCTISATVSLVDIYDHNGNVITTSYIENHIDIKERALSHKSERYTWKIDDGELVGAIKSAASGCDGYKSDVFMLHGFRWLMEIYPNGNTPESKGSFKWYLNLLSLSSTIQRVSFYYELSLEETGTKRKSATWFDHTSYSDGWLHSHLKTEDIQKAMSFTFDLTMRIFDVFDAKGNVLDDYTPFLPQPCLPQQHGTFIWNSISEDLVQHIKEASHGRYFESNVFGMYDCKWFLRLYPSGGETGICDLFLRLLTLPKNVATICIKYELFHKETDTRYSTFTQFDKADDSEGWPRHKLKTEELKQCETLTFGVNISLIDMYDEQGVNISYTSDCKEATFPAQTHTWAISDAMLDRMKDARNGDIIQSKIFMSFGLKWMQEMYPNGANQSSLGWSGWYLNIISFPAHICSITFQFRIILYDEHMDNALVRGGRTHLVTFRDSTVWWGSKRIELQRLLECKALHFVLQITVLEVLNDNGESVTVFPKYDTMNTMSGEHVWYVKQEDIRCAVNGECFDSNVFDLCGAQWILRLYPNGREKDQKGEVKLSLHLKQFPSTVESMSVHFQFEIDETQTIYFNFANFRKGYVSKGWRTSYLKTRELNDIEQLTIKVEITVIDRYDATGHIIPFEKQDKTISKCHSSIRYVSYSQ
eukprot:32260_1